LSEELLETVLGLRVSGAERDPFLGLGEDVGDPEIVSVDRDLLLVGAQAASGRKEAQGKRRQGDTPRAIRGHDGLRGWGEANTAFHARDG
jgi:hypothetical protein